MSFFLTPDEVAARLAAPDCSDEEREWFATVRPFVPRPIARAQLHRKIGNPFEATS